MPIKLRMEDKNILEHYTDLAVGDVFAGARRNSGLSLEQAAQQTLIRADVIDAIEKADVEKLPSRVYTLGFLRNYADFLGLDADKMIYLYKIQVIGEDVNDNAASRRSKQQRWNISFLPMLLLGGGGLLILAAFGIVGYTMLTALWDKPSPEQSAVSTHAVTALTDDLAQKKDMILQQADDAFLSSLSEWRMLEMPDHNKGAGRVGLVLPAEGAKAYGKDWHAKGIVLKATKSVWIKLSSSEGDLLLNTVLQKGDVVQIAPDAMISMETLYAQALDVYLAGHRAGYLKGAENEQRNVILSKSTMMGLLNPRSMTDENTTSTSQSD